MQLKRLGKNISSNKIESHIIKLRCSECGQTSSEAYKIVKTGPNEFFNFIPLCSKHYLIIKKLGLSQSLDLCRNISTDLFKHRGWTIDGSGLLTHKDIK